MRILRCTCIKCSKLLINKEKYSYLLNYNADERWNKVFALASKKKRCGECSHNGCGCLQPKLKKEGLAVKYSQLGVKVIGLRYFNVFGKGQSKEYAGVLKLFLEKIRDGLPPKINGDGTQFRDFVYVEDVANANIMSMDSNVDHDFFNVGTNTSITILDLAKTIIKFLIIVRYQFENLGK